MELKERLQIVEKTLSVTEDNVPVFAGLGEKNFNMSYELLKSYLKLGCNKILFQIPFENEAQFKSRFLKLADLQPKVIMLQDWDESGYGLPDSLIVELFENVEAFRCLKIETHPAGIKYSRIRDLTDGRLHLSGGWAVTQMLEGLRRGVHAFMPTAMHYIYTQIYNDYVFGSRSEARQLFERILPVLSFSNQHLDISIHFFKRLLFRQGIYKTDRVRQPAIVFDTIHEEIADELIHRVIELENQIKKNSLNGR